MRGMCGGWGGDDCGGVEVTEPAWFRRLARRWPRFLATICLMAAKLATHSRRSGNA